jgi:hypothetical protein
MLLRYLIRNAGAQPALSDARIPVWWTQHPAELPVLTGRFGGPKTDGMTRLQRAGTRQAGLASLADIFGLVPKELMRDLVAARAINLGARSPRTRSLFVRDARNALGAVGARKL